MKNFNKLDIRYILTILISIELSSLFYLRNSELCYSYLENEFSSIFGIFLIMLQVPLYLLFGKFVFIVILLFESKILFSNYHEFWTISIQSIAIGLLFAFILMFFSNKISNTNQAYFYPKLLGLSLYIVLSPIFLQSFFMSMGV